VRIFTGPRIVPLAGPDPEAFAVDGEWVVATGPRAELRERYPSAEWVDLDGALVVPGFNDAHCHPWLQRRALSPLAGRAGPRPG
jgi:predicted amidohydrolase YtcJ